MPRIKRVEVFSIVIDLGNGEIDVKNSVSAEEVKVILAGLVNDDKAYVFAGPQVSWSSEIVLHAVDAPTQQPADKPRRKYTKRKDAAAKDEPPKGANGEGRKTGEAQP